MCVLVVNATLHFADWVEQHVVTERIRPIRHRKSALKARYEAARHEQDEDGHSRNAREEARGGWEFDRLRSTREEAAERRKRRARDEETTDVGERHPRCPALFITQERADDEKVCKRAHEAGLHGRRAGTPRDRAKDNRHCKREYEERFANPEAWCHHRDVPDAPHRSGCGEAKRQMHGPHEVGREVRHNREHKEHRKQSA